jgi:hypothetical protein
MIVPDQESLKSIPGLTAVTAVLCLDVCQPGLEKNRITVLASRWVQVQYPTPYIQYMYVYHLLYSLLLYDLPVPCTRSTVHTFGKLQPCLFCHSGCCCHTFTCCIFRCCRWCRWSRWCQRCEATHTQMQPRTILTTRGMPMENTMRTLLASMYQPMWA